MTVRSFKLLLLGFAAPLAGPAITLEQLVDSALRQNPGLEFYKGSLEAGHIEASSLPMWDVPELRLGYGRDSNVSEDFRSATYPDHDYQASLRVFPKNPWERQAEQRRLKSQNSLLQLSLSEGEQVIAARVKELYWECAYLGAELRLKEQLLEVLAEKEARQQALLESGQITVGQSLPSKMNRLEVAMEVESLQRSIEGASAGLAGLCAVEPEEIEFATPGPLTADDFDLPYGTWHARALGQRVDVQRYETQAESARAELDTIKARRIPWINHVEAGYRVRNQYGAEDSVGIEFAVSLPFFSSDGGEKRSAKRMLETHHRQASQARRIAELEVQALVAEFMASERQWRTQGEQLSSMQAELSAAITSMEAQGSRAEGSFWDARVSLLQLEVKQLELSRDYQRLRLKAATVLGDEALIGNNVRHQE